MRDETGLYYFPDLADKNVRMYVRKNSSGEIEYRMWEQGHPEVWDDHQWLTREVVAQVQELYRQKRNSGANPLALYDEKVAIALLKNSD